MARSNDFVRRTTGAVLIGIAILMLILGQTVLADTLQQTKLRFVLYWLACFGFTALAAFVALLDMVVVRQRIRKQQREFLENTLKEIAAKQAKARQEHHKE